MFPSDWSTQTGLRRHKRPRAPDSAGGEGSDLPPSPTSGKIADPHAPPAPPAADALFGSEPPLGSASTPLEDLHLPSLILRNVNTASRAPATPAELNLDAILSRVPYREILENLYGREHYPHPDVPVITRAYEEAFLREPMPHSGERPCVAGELCECNFIDPCMPFVGVEFTLPSESITRPDVPQFCVLCSRKVTQKLFYDVLFTGKDVHGVIQRYGNLCSVQGEYARECMLVCPPHAPLHCMPLPVMSHQRNKYRVRISNGIKHIEQLRVGHEDFASPLTEGQS
jgi:hypothetical protein